MADLSKTRAAAGAISAILGFFFIAASLMSNHLYSGSASHGTPEELGWWEADVDYGYFNGSIWVGENDNLIGNPNYTAYVIDYDEDGRALVIGSAAGLAAGVVLALVSFAFGLLTSFRVVSWLLPFSSAMLAFIAVLISLLLLHNGIPDIVRSDIDMLGPELSEAIPPEEVGMLTKNLSHGRSFDLGYLSLPFLAVSSLLVIGIRRESLPSRDRLASGFFISDGEMVKRPKEQRMDEQVKRGSLEDPER